MYIYTTTSHSYYVNNETADENASGAINAKSNVPESTDVSAADDDDDGMEVDDESAVIVDEDSNSQAPILGGHQKVDVSQIRRNILAAKPRVTRYSINWDEDDSATS